MDLSNACAVISGGASGLGEAVARAFAAAGAPVALFDLDESRGAAVAAEIGLERSTPPACRFEPTCSVYAAEAIETHGLYGIWLAVKRILKCQPFHPGGYDPVPPPRPRR